MIETLIKMARDLLCLLPFILFALLNAKANLKREVRSRQFPMPLLTLVYCVILFVFLSRINGLLSSLLYRLPELLAALADKVAGLWDGALSAVAGVLEKLAELLESFLQKVNPVYLLLYVANAVFMLAHVILKRILITIFKVVFKNGGGAHDFFAGPFYEQDQESGKWHVRDHFGQARTFLKTLYYTALVLSAAAVLVSCQLYRKDLLRVPFYPVFGLMIVGEVCFFLDGLNRREMEGELSGEADEAGRTANYALLRGVLSRLFGDKLCADNTTVDSGAGRSRTHDELLHELESSDDVKLEAYGRFMRRKSRAGLELDHNYLDSGRALLCGNSILFNNPFYYDLIPYVAYPMNRTLLQGKRVLIVLGRHGIEEDAQTWCREGLAAITGVPSLWNIGVLSDRPQELDVGVVTRSSVHDLALHEANREFFREVEFVVILEPSRLVTTAQIGLNSLVRHCTRDGKKLTFCSADKNCDGLVDALSHILLTSLTEVSATNHHTGASSYMCWETDSEHWQHRLLPNLSRYLGVGTELSFAALKNQVAQTQWYGGEVFPVTDIHWIARQYYYDLLHYAGLPVSQESMDDYFKTSPNLWNARVRDNQYLTVEDEACNMFELRREFATRARKQGFVNIISPEYLLKDYMADNNGLFNADPKAIPCIVADYAPTVRNVVLRLCLRMSTGMVSEEELRRELMLADIPVRELRRDLWHEICRCCRGLGKSGVDREGSEILTVEHDAGEIVFKPEVLRLKRRFSLDSGKMESLYYISDARFIELLLGDLRSAGYIAEDEKGEKQYLGSELRGHIFQKYLPGQFFTFGGKYYEMLRVTSTGQVQVRRAADHITGRPAYRQVRHYRLSDVADCTGMGDRMDVAGLTVTRQTADIRVETPAYWKLERYNDFAGGRLVSVNGVPERAYYGKQVLRIDLPEQGLTDEVCATITILFNEVFRTLFAENHAYIAAVMPGNTEIPMTYGLEGVQGSRCIYIIEDSQLDLGLLVSVQRNLNRIFAILCDYLDWHMDAVEKSLNPPPEPETPEPEPEPEEEAAEKAKGLLGRLTQKVKAAVRKVGEFFRKLFKRKAKDAPQEEPSMEEQTAEQEPEYTSAPLSEEENQGVIEPDYDAAEDPTDTAEPEAGPAEPGDAVPEEPEETEEPEEESFSLMSVGADMAEESAEAAAPEHDVEQDELIFEPAGGEKPAAATATRRPYHERYYLLYGGSEVPAILDVEGTHAYLAGMGFDRSGLKQARAGMNTAEMIEKNYDPQKAGGRFCDFCGSELTGAEYEILPDGRERCVVCGRTAVKTEEEFREIYTSVIRDLESFFGARITAPVKVEMVNARKLHKRLGRSFIPTGSFDGRILGVAIKNGKGYSILVENGAPRMQSAMTIAHELIHIWQYLNWDKKAILKRYGKSQELEIYEGMAKWGEIQYAYWIGETAAAKREEIVTRLRQDEYGRGFRKYAAKYPLSAEIRLSGETPFRDKEKPL